MLRSRRRAARPEGERREREEVEAEDRDDGGEGGEERLVAELAEHRDDQDVVQLQLRGRCEQPPPEPYPARAPSREARASGGGSPRLVDSLLGKIAARCAAAPQRSPAGWLKPQEMRLHHRKSQRF